MIVHRSFERAVARRLEGGVLGAGLFSPRWDPVRSLDLPPVRVIGVGGATLGGSGRTPLAIALVEAIAARGARVALVGHGHRAKVDGAVQVHADDDPGRVGDEALLAARALHAPVFVGRDRGEVLRLAARRADVLVVDRLLQTRPARLACSILAVDARGAAPWPFGDLVAPWRSLRAACDVVVEIGSAVAPVTVELPPLPERFGLVTSVARPARVLASLPRSPIVHLERGDHAPGSAGELRLLDALRRRHRLEAWVADAKTCVLLPELGALPVRHFVTPSEALVDRVLGIEDRRSHAPADARLARP